LSYSSFTYNDTETETMITHKDMGVFLIKYLRALQETSNNNDKRREHIGYRGLHE
jgi:hypothetical protein